MTSSINDKIRERQYDYDMEVMGLIERLRDINVITPSKMNSKTQQLLNQNPEVKHDIRDMTRGCDHLSDKERIMLIVEGHCTVPVCPTCGTVVTFNHRTTSWNRYCDSRCAMKDPAMQGHRSRRR